MFIEYLPGSAYPNDYFSIAYEVDSIKSGFFPDYIIKFIDGRIGIFEAKDKNDNSKDTKLKAERLFEYIEQENRKGKNLVGGIVSNFGDNVNIYIKINRKAEYNIKPNDWEDLENII